MFTLFPLVVKIQLAHSDALVMEEDFLKFVLDFDKNF